MLIFLETAVLHVFNSVQTEHNASKRTITLASAGMTKSAIFSEMTNLH